MEDSGIDSEDKLSYQKDSTSEITKLDEESDDDNDNNFEIAFRGIHGGNRNKNHQNAINCNTDENNMKYLNNQPSSCRVLQRKLELKVERAKKNYNQYQLNDNNVVFQATKKLKSSNLIPINRLQIPGYTENQPLVDYKSDSVGNNDNADDDDDDIDEISFFPSNKLRNFNARQELSDTFSLQEMTIESDNSDDSGSQNLELLPPLVYTKSVYFHKFCNWLCCSNECNDNEIN